MWNNSNIHKKIFTEIKPGSETNKNKKYKTSRRDIGKNGGERKKKFGWMIGWTFIALELQAGRGCG